MKEEVPLLELPEGSDTRGAAAAPESVFLGLSCPANSALQDCLYSIFVEGIPVPTPSLSTFLLTGESPKSFVHKVFIPDRDAIHYKIEASADWPFGWGPPSPVSAATHQNGGGPVATGGAPKGGPTFAAEANNAPLACPVCEGKQQADSSQGPLPLLGPLGDCSASCIERGSTPIRKVQPTQLLIYVSYPYCCDVWDAGASELFVHYIADKPLAQCSVSLLNRGLHGADLFIEIRQVSRDLAIRRELALQLSRMRQRLQCGPVQHFLRSLAKRRHGALRRIQLRPLELLWLRHSEGTVSFIHRFVCEDVLSWSLTLKYCQDLAKEATRDPRRRLSEASASTEPPEIIREEVEKAQLPPDELAVYLLLGVSTSFFSSDFSAGTRSLRALSLSEMLISIQPHVEAVVRRELVRLRRLWRPGA